MPPHWTTELKLEDAVNTGLHVAREPLRPPRLCIKARYDNVVIASGAFTPTYRGPVLVHRVEGAATLRAGGAEAQLPLETLLQEENNSVALTIGPGAVLSVCSAPLTPEALRALESVKSEYITVSWTVRGAISYDPGSIARRPQNMPLASTALLSIKGTAKLTMIDLVKGVLEPATATRRLIIEIPLPEARELGGDEDMRRALATLKGKAELLEEARKALLEARDSTGYRNAIDHVRKAIEGLTLSTPEGQTPCHETSTLCKALEKALRTESIITSEDQAKTDEELTKIIKTLNEISKAIYKLTSTLGVHARGYTPHPQREEAEATLHLATVYIKYLTETIQRAARKT